MSSIMQRAQDVRATATQRGQAYLNQGQQALDARWPPQHRAKLSNSIRSWASQNPRLFFFLALNLVLTGPPVTIFLLFSVSTLLASLAACIITALIIALSFTGFCIGAALFLLVPTIFVTVSLATGIFVWGVVGFWILQRIDESKTPVPFVKSVVQKVQSLGEKPATSKSEELADDWSKEYHLDTNGEGKVGSIMFDIPKKENSQIVEPDRSGQTKGNKTIEEIKAEQKEKMNGAAPPKVESFSIDGVGATL